MSGMPSQCCRDNLVVYGERCLQGHRGECHWLKEEVAGRKRILGMASQGRVGRGVKMGSGNLKMTEGHW